MSVTKHMAAAKKLTASRGSDSQAATANEMIRASAGTGKTFQLSNRFLRLLFDGVHASHILATTFTRKAAGEILGRIVTRLAEAAESDKAADKLSKEIERKATRKACLTRLNDLIDNLHRMRVCTLDAFYAQVAGSFSLELGLPPNWRIAEDDQYSSLQADALQRLIHDKQSDVIRIMHLLNKGDSGRPVAASLSQTIERLHEAYLDAPDSAWNAIKRKKLISRAESQQLFDEFCDLEIEKKSIAKGHKKSVEWLQVENWEKLLESGLTAKIAKGETKFSRQEIEPYILDVHRRVIAHVADMHQNWFCDRIEGAYELLKRFDVHFREVLQEKSVLRFNDITRCLADSASSDSPNKWTYRLDGQIDHLMLDEFQDTSPPQWAAIRPIAQSISDDATIDETSRAVGSTSYATDTPRIKRVGRRKESLPGQQLLFDDGAAEIAAPHLPATDDTTDQEGTAEQKPPISRSVFCVGDTKQAIYGWRGGEAELFDTLPKVLGDIRQSPLDVSYRSSQPVIDSVNKVFRDLSPIKSQKIAGNWQKEFRPHATARDELPGCVFAHGVQRGDKDTHNELDAAADIIADVHRKNPNLTIAALVRRNVVVPKLLNFIQRRGIQASGESGNPITDSAAVDLVMSLMKLADHPANAVAYFHLMNSPWAEQLRQFASNDNPAFARLELARTVRAQLAEVGYGKMTRAWAKQLAKFCSPREARRLQQLVELAQLYDPRSTTRPRDFVQFIGEIKKTDPLAVNIRVMTFHQAKGLQFDVVVLPELDFALTGRAPRFTTAQKNVDSPIKAVVPYVNEKLRPILPPIFDEAAARHQDRSINESLCMLYVAMTRAVHSMHLILSDKNSSGSSKAGDVIRHAYAGQLPSAGQVRTLEGDENWLEKVASRSETARKKLPMPRTIELPILGGRRRRGLDATSPSNREGGSRVSAKDKLSLESTEAMRYGTLIHAWMEQVDWLDEWIPTSDKLRIIAQQMGYGERQIDEFLTVFKRSLVEPNAAKLLNKEQYIASFVNSSEFSSADLVVRNEQRISYRKDGALLSGNIDRLIVWHVDDKPVAADIVDYKTDDLAKKKLADRIEHYRPQVEAYREAISSMLLIPTERVFAKLLFLQKDECVSV